LLDKPLLYALLFVPVNIIQGIFTAIEIVITDVETHDDVTFSNYDVYEYHAPYKGIEVVDGQG